MIKIPVKTISAEMNTQKVSLSGRKMDVLVKNFGSGNVWVGLTEDSTQDDGMVRIPTMTAQVLPIKHSLPWGVPASIYVYADYEADSCIEIMEIDR